MNQAVTSAAPEVDPATGLRVGTFAVGTFESAGRALPALVHPDGSVLDLSDRFRDTHEILDDWETNFTVLGDLSAEPARATLRVEKLRPLPPLSHPNLLMAGANYKTHVAQMLTKNKFNQHNRKPGETDEEFFQRNYEMMEQRAREGTPFFWTGLHSALVGANDDIFRRPDVTWGYDWISKHQPTFKPAGPFIVPAQFVEIDENVRITLSVNGQVMQDWPVNDFVFG